MPVETSKISLTNFLARVDNEHVFSINFSLTSYEPALFEYANNFIIMVSTSCRTPKTVSASYKPCMIIEVKVLSLTMTLTLVLTPYDCFNLLLITSIITVMCSLHEVVTIFFVQSYFQRSYKQLKPTLKANFKIIYRILATITEYLLKDDAQAHVK